MHLVGGLAEQLNLLEGHSESDIVHLDPLLPQKKLTPSGVHSESPPRIRATSSSDSLPLAIESI